MAKDKAAPETPKTRQEEIAEVTKLIDDLANLNSKLGGNIDAIREDRKKLVAQIAAANERLAELCGAGRGISATAPGATAVVTGREVMEAVAKKFGQ